VVTRAGATSENAQKAKFAEFLFHALEWMGFSPMLEEERL
jgi:hypothetical protein